MLIKLISAMLIKLKNTKTKIPRFVTVSANLYIVLKKYYALLLKTEKHLLAWLLLESSITFNSYKASIMISLIDLQMNMRMLIAGQRKRNTRIHD
ncbi:hypothetical protein JTB14_019261 [Gonioctena quinquepunctata]|nr:hypothetical protein JTB14_019261 [Gonioctena quinquepunctata]